MPGASPGVAAAVADVLPDLGDSDLCEGQVWHDVAASVRLDADPAVALKVCKCQLGAIPGELVAHGRRTGVLR